MRIHVSDDMGTGGFIFLCVGLMLSIIFENEPCVSCFQVSIVSLSPAGWPCAGIPFSSWSVPEPGGQALCWLSGEHYIHESQLMGLVPASCILS